MKSTHNDAPDIDMIHWWIAAFIAELGIAGVLTVIGLLHNVGAGVVAFISAFIFFWIVEWVYNTMMNVPGGNVFPRVVSLALSIFVLYGVNLWLGHTLSAAWLAIPGGILFLIGWLAIKDQGKG